MDGLPHPALTAYSTKYLELWRLGRTQTFVRTARRLLKRDPNLTDPVATALELLETEPHHPHLKLHRLHGGLDGLWAARVTPRIRLIFTIDREEKEIILLDIGSHDEVYR